MVLRPAPENRNGGTAVSGASWSVLGVGSVPARSDGSRPHPDTADATRCGRQLSMFPPNAGLRAAAATRAADVYIRIVNPPTFAGPAAAAWPGDQVGSGMSVKCCLS